MKRVGRAGATIPPPGAVRSARRDLLRALDEALETIGPVFWSVSEVVAQRLGLNTTDLWCLRWLQRTGTATAGRVAEQMCLTTGATTAVLDRLERHGLVRRVRDPRDRRRVLVEVEPAARSRLRVFEAAFRRKLREMEADYDNNELAVLTDYIGRVVTAGATYLEWLERTKPPARSAIRAARRNTQGRGKTAP